MQIAVLTFIICSVILSLSHVSQQCTAQHLKHLSMPEHVPHSLIRLITVICSEKGYCLLSYVCLQRKYTPYGKRFYQILWGINVKAIHNYSRLFVRARLKKWQKKERKYNGLTGIQKSALSRPDFPFIGLPLNTEILSLEIVTCKLLLLKRPTIPQFLNSGWFAGFFLLII